MKVRCNLCGKIFPNETAYLDGEHDKRVHARADMQSYAEPLLAKTPGKVVNKRHILKDEDAVR